MKPTARTVRPPSSARRGLRAILRHGEDGQVMPIAMVMFLLMASLMFLVYNTGAAVNAKTQAQNAADAAAHTGAVWEARGLNLIADNNQASSGIIARIILMRALDKAILEAQKNVQQERARAAAMIAAGSQSGNIQLVLQGTQLMLAVQRESDILDSMRSTLTTAAIDGYCADKTGSLWSACNSLQFFSTAIAMEIPEVANNRARTWSTFSTDGEGFAMIAWPTWMAVRQAPGFSQSGNNNAAAAPGGTGGNLPVVVGTFADFQSPITTGKPPQATTGRQGQIRPGPYNRTLGALGAFFQTALPITGGQQMINQYAQTEFDTVFTKPGPQNWMPAPLELAANIKLPATAVASGADLRELAVWAVAGRSSTAPFWSHRFVNPAPGELALATARAKVTNPVSWDLWTAQWQAKLTHADWTYDRLTDPFAIGPDNLAANLAVLTDPGYPGAPPIAPREQAGVSSLLGTMSKRNYTWDDYVGRALNTH